jgi:hypothetical protein
LPYAQLARPTICLIKRAGGFFNHGGAPNSSSPVAVSAWQNF